jgi:cellulose synthase/poly-beta-1,6-N-acetylglucosamine synthase-like glycosyltransferase
VTSSPDSGIPTGSVPGRPAPRTLAGLSIVLPCFDRQDTIADAVRAATRAAERVAADHEIIVVNDGSSDATATVAAALVGWDRRVRLLVHARLRGYGDAVRTGIGAARMPWVLLTDPLRFDVDALETLVPAAAEADLVVDHAVTLIRLETLDGLLLAARGTTITTELRVKAVAGGARVRDIGRASGRTAQHEHNTVLHEAQRWLGTLPRMQQPGSRHRLDRD